MNKKAFTLVELLIVITILAILGLISFISIQGFTTDARDAKRISDVISLLDKITIENTKGVNYFELIEQTTKTGTLLKINGEPRPGEQNIKNGVNFQVLKENAKDFIDPLNGHSYPFAYAEGNAGGMGYSFVQLAYVEEKTGTTKLVGNYYEMLPGDSPSLFVGCITNSKKELENNDCPIYDILVSDEANSSSTTENNNCANYTPGNGKFETGNPTTSNTDWQTASPSSPCYVSCNSGYTWDSGSNSCEVISGISIGSQEYEEGGFTRKEITIINGSTEYVIMDRNVGATTNDISLCTISSCPTSIAGIYYQWGKFDDTFKKGNIDWGSTNNSWGGATDTKTNTDTSTNTGLRKGPCPSGWHIPSIAEWNGLVDMYLNDIKKVQFYFLGYSYSGDEALQFCSDLMLPAAGLKYWYNGNIKSQGSYGGYWSSSPSASSGLLIFFRDSSVNLGSIENRAQGLSVRCFKNQIN